MGIKKIRVAVSACLLGQKVRWDGDDKLSPVVFDILGKDFEWVPICPELEIGMGVPRERVRLIKNVSAEISMLGVETQSDWTARMHAYAIERVLALRAQKICGYIFQNHSPSCGVDDTPVYSTSGETLSFGSGLFAAALLQEWPSLPLIDEKSLNESERREWFLAQVLRYAKGHEL